MVGDWCSEGWGVLAGSALQQISEGRQAAALFGGLYDDYRKELEFCALKILLQEFECTVPGKPGRLRVVFGTILFDKPMSRAGIGIKLNVHAGGRHLFL